MRGQTSDVKWYADTPRLLCRQLLADTCVAAWMVGWAWLAAALHDLLAQLAEPGAQVEASARDVARQLDRAGAEARDLPLVGDPLAAPLDAAANAARGLAAAGAAGHELASQVAWWLPLLIAAGPVVAVLVWWLPARLRWIREATAASRLRSDTELFAWRALAHRPLREVARIAPDPVAALRRGDPHVVARLADLELTALGLRRR